MRKRWVGMVALVAIEAVVVTLLQQPAHAEDPIVVNIPVITYDQPIVLNFDPPTAGTNYEYIPGTVSIPVGEPVGSVPTQVASQCTPIPGVPGALCMGNPTSSDQPPLDVIGIEELSPVLKTPEAQGALGWMVDEAVESIRAMSDLPRDNRIERYGRDQIRAYMLQRLLNIMDKRVGGVVLTADERQALDFVESSFLTDDRMLAQAAYDEFEHFMAVGCGYHEPSAPAIVTDPVVMPKEVADWCAVPHAPEVEAFMFAPPIPSVDDFTSWGAYRRSHDLGLDVIGNDEVQKNLRDMAVGYTLLGAVGVATAAAGIAVAIVASSTLIADGIAGVLFPFAGVSTFVADAAPIAGATIGVSAGAAAAVVAVVILFVVVTAISIWKLIEHEKIGLTLEDRLDDALAASDPLGLDALTAQYSGTPFLSWYADGAPTYRQTATVNKLAAKIALWTTVDESGTVIGDPTGVWSGGATAAASARADATSATAAAIEPEIKFTVKVGANAATQQATLTVPQDPGPAKVHFSQRWMVVQRFGETAQPAFSFSYRDPLGVAHLASRAPSTMGGFFITKEVDGLASGAHVPAIYFRNANDVVVKVSLPPSPSAYLAGPRPVAVGPLWANRPVNLRPNPVNVNGSSVDPVVAETEFTYAWTVSRLTPNGTWSTVATSPDYGTKFTPDQAGTYYARVTMTSLANPSIQKFGAVQFDISPPPILESIPGHLIDNGSTTQEFDIQLREEVPSDTITIRVQWQPDLDGVPAETTVVLPCVQTGPIECTTPRTGLLDNLIRTLTSNTDLRQPVKVQVSNSYGASVEHLFEIANPGRPSILPPPAGANDSQAGSVLVGESTTQVIMPLVAGNTDYMAATLAPGLNIGQDDFALVDPATGNTTASILLPGSDNLIASAAQDADGIWRLYVSGHPDVLDLGTFEVPIVISQTNTNTNLIVLTIHVVPSSGDRYRLGYDSSINPQDFATPTLPVLEPVILGGQVDWPAYAGDLCVSLIFQSYPPFTQGTKCGPQSWFFTAADAPKPFPYAELFPGGMIAGKYEASFWLDGIGDHVDNTPLTRGFQLTAGATYPAPAVVAGKPVVSGKAQVGKVLTSSPGLWYPATTTLTRQWLRDGAPIAGATASSYLVRPGDVGHRLSLRVRGTAPSFTQSTAVSALTAKAIKGVLTLTPRPTISGTPAVGRKLTAHPGTWNAGVTLRYRWLANGQAITGATGKTLVLTRALRGKRIAVVVTGSKPGYVTVRRTSAATAPVR